MDGQGYYVDANGVSPEPVKKPVNIYDETAFSAAFMAKAKQGGR